MVGEKAKRSEVSQSCPTLCHPVDCVHGIFQAKIPEWVVISFSRESSRPRDRTRVSCIIGRRFTIWATREVFYGRRVGVNSSWPHLLPNFSLLHLSWFFFLIKIIILLLSLLFFPVTAHLCSNIYFLFSEHGWENVTRLNICTQEKEGGGVGERLKREGIYVYLQPIQVIIQQKPTQYCKAIVLQLKIKNK